MARHDFFARFGISPAWLAARAAAAGLWWWAVLRLTLWPGTSGIVEGAVAAGGWGLSLLPVHCVPWGERARGGGRRGSGSGWGSWRGGGGGGGAGRLPGAGAGGGAGIGVGIGGALRSGVIRAWRGLGRGRGRSRSRSRSRGW
ncbi:hypothetical protein [Streptomyces sp. NPDC052496]|uniref:hypothetical protein n=1 Tax=Streptomyces sp. NPDC052496 TaxID=3154951 RepID=UPI0034191536